MSKIKLPSRSPSIDMTPMVDLFFLLLTFFMLTTSFKPTEAAPIDTPSSSSELFAPDKDVITVFVSKDNRVFFNMDGGRDTSLHVRRKLISEIKGQFQINLTDEQEKKFEKLASFGLPKTDLVKWIDATDNSIREKLQTGIPTDSLDNQLALWILCARNANPTAKAQIKGDANSDFKVIKKIIDILQDYKINTFSLTTNLQKETVSTKDLN